MVKEKKDEWAHRIERWFQVASLVVVAAGGARWALTPVINLSSQVREQQEVTRDVLFMLCPLYSKNFEGAPVPERCLRRGMRP